MLQSLKAKLTRSKTVPLTDDQIRRHRDQRRQRDEWTTDVDALRGILDRLKTDYALHKGDFAVGRYEELKTMVKTAVDESKAAVTVNKERRQAGRSAAEPGLKDTAADFANIQERLKTDEKLYADTSPAELDAETEKFRRDVLQLKQDFRIVKERLDALAVAYEKSKQLNPAHRYTALKEMIKEATV